MTISQDKGDEANEDGEGAGDEEALGDSATYSNCKSTQKTSGNSQRYTKHVNPPLGERYTR